MPVFGRIESAIPSGKTKCVPMHTMLVSGGCWMWSEIASAVGVILFHRNATVEHSVMFTTECLIVKCADRMCDL